MLTFSEALVLLKAGEDMQHKGWPNNAFVRAMTVGGSPQLRKFIGKTVATYIPTQAELFGQDWSKA